VRQAVVVAVAAHVPWLARTLVDPMSAAKRPSRVNSQWVAFHDEMDEHPKVEPLTDAAYRAWHRLIFYCHRRNLDGRIPKHRWDALRQSIRTELTKVQPGQKWPLVDVSDATGAVLHDYLDWQRSADEIDAARQDASKGGTLGNHRRWHEGRNVIDPKCRYCRPNRSTDQGADQSPDRESDRSTESIGRSGTDR
jgi:hypothetical protein